MVIAANSKHQVSFSSGRAKVMVGGQYSYIHSISPPADAVGVQIETTVALEEGARLERATFTIGASPGALTRAASVAVIRRAPAYEGDDACVLDFGRMVTVSGFGLSGGSLDANAVYPWAGSSWGFRNRIDAGDSGFPEVLTERLLVTTDDNGDLEEAIQDYGVVVLPGQPTFLELLVDGTTVWFDRQGSTTDLVTKDSSGHSVVSGGDGAVQYAIDRTNAVRDALSKLRPNGGKREVTVVLRAATPGQLNLRAVASMIHEHTIVFGSNSVNYTIDAADEGSRLVALGKPFTGADRIHEVALTLKGAFGPERVEPVDGPSLDADTDLILGMGRTLLFGIPRSLTELFGELQGFRLHLASERGGEIAGRLLGVTTSGEPGEPLKNGQIPPVQVAAEHNGWFTIGPPEPVQSPAQQAPAEQGQIALWLEVVASYGEITCGLTYATGGAPIRRQLPGGGTKKLSTPHPPDGPEQILYAALRVVGLPGRKELRPAVEVSVAGSTSVAPADPSNEDLRVTLRLAEGIAPSPAGEVPLTIKVAATGTVSLENVLVAYKKGAQL